MPTTSGNHPARPAKIVGAARGFKKRFKGKSPEDRQAIENALRELERDRGAPSLRVSKVRGVPGSLWEARASRSLRITFTLERGEIRLRNNCTHDQVYRRAG